MSIWREDLNTTCPVQILRSMVYYLSQHLKLALKFSITLKCEYYFISNLPFFFPTEILSAKVLEFCHAVLGGGIAMPIILLLRFLVLFSDVPMHL